MSPILRFEEKSEDDSDSDDNKHFNFIKPDNNNDVTKTQINQIEHKCEIKKLTFNLVKNRLKKETSFGFHLAGDSSKKGDHFIDCISENSAAERVGLKQNDKIIKVNGIDVENSNINNLIDLIGYETTLNDFKLNLIVLRNESTKENNVETKDSNKRSISSLQEDEMEKQKKQQKTNNDTSVKNIINVEYDLNKSSSLSLANEFDLSGFMPAAQIEQTFMTANVQTQQNDNAFEEKASIKTLEQIRLEKIGNIKFVSPQRPIKRSNVPSKVILDVKAKEIQKRLSEQGKYVNWQEVVYELLQLYDGCEQIGDLGLAQVDHLETISEIIRIHRRIDTLVMSAEIKVSFITLMGLEQFICADYNHYFSRSNPNSKIKKVNKFEELYVGPLIKNQIIRKVFQIPDEVQTIKQLKLISSRDLIKHLTSYLQENDLWSCKVKQNDFEAYLIKKLKVDSINMLGTKIANLGMLIGSLKTVQHLYSDSLKEIKSNIDLDFKVVFQNEKTWLFKKLNEKLTTYRQQDFFNENSTLVMQTNSSLNYLKSNSIEIIADLLSLFEKLLDKNEFYYINDFLNVLKDSTYLRDCFQLAICLGKHDLDLCLKQIQTNLEDYDGEFYSKYKSLLKRLFFMIIDSKTKSNRELKRFLNRYLKEKNLKIVDSDHKKFDDDDDENDNENEENLQTDKNSILDKDQNLNTKFIADADERLVEFIKMKIEPNSTLTYEHLSKIENSIYENLSYKFMDLLFRNKYLFEQNGLKVILFESGDKFQDKVQNQFKKTSFLEHIKQLQFSLSQNFQNNEFFKNLEKLICLYYSINVVEDYGLGDLNTLLYQAKSSDSNSGIIYGDSIIYDHATSINLESHLNLEVIIEKLNNCPLLENVYDYLDWSNKWSKKFGDLKIFLSDLNNGKISNTNGFKINLLELENDSNKLLKLASSTSIEKLKESIEIGDPINTIGHLISLVCVNYKSFNLTPHSLLINEIQSSLSKFLSKCNNQDQDEYFNQIYGYVYNYLNHGQNLGEFINRNFLSFIIEVIYRIPTKFQYQLLLKYILEPLVELNADHQVKEKLFYVLVINSCLGNVNPFIRDKKIDYFIELGDIFSFNEWSNANYKSIIHIISSKPKFLMKEKIDLQLNKESLSLKPSNIKPDITMIDENVTSADIEDIKENNQDQVNEFNDKKEISIENVISDIETNEFKHIQSIRQRYGIGLELNDETKSVTESLKGVIGRSLESLSNELYNKDMHFVLELIQNADDNTYPTLNNLQPTLIFLIENDRITLFNNEIGFDQRNIDAICDVKASTKGKHQRGYIGRKGIGFKSVFTITDQPEIHSNGYHLKFDLSNGHIGYILPNWITDSTNLNELEKLKNLIREKIEQNTINLNQLTSIEKIGPLSTCIKLPLKSESEMQRHKSSLLTNNFNDIKPYLLLFLNRLRNLIIINKKIENKNLSTRNEFVYHREDLDENLIEIKSNIIDTTQKNTSKLNKWFVVRECLQVPPNLKPSQDVESTDLCFAFPIDQLDDSNNKMPKLDVFAYLPLRSFGFKFIIQADFVVPASRQDINQDSDWNQWIVKQIPSLFVKTLDYFKNHKIFQDNEFKALQSFLRFIPLEEEILGFFQHIPRQIIELLRNKEFLPAIETIINDGIEEEQLVWKRPFECVIVKDDDIIRQVLTSDLLKKYLGRYYLHSSLLNKNEINQKLLTNLGVHYIDINDILEILKTVFSLNQFNSNSSTNSDSNLNFNDIKTTAKWLVVLQHCLNGSYSLQQEDKFIKQLKQLPFIPILKFDYSKNEIVKEMVSLENMNVFFPSNIKLNNNSSKSRLEQKNKIVNLIEKDLNLLDSESLLCLDHLKNAQIISLLKNLGVKQIEPYEVIENHILTVLDDKNLTNSKPEDILILYLVYVYQFFGTLQFNLNKLKKVLLVKTNKGFKSVNSLEINETVYLSQSYGNKYDFKSMFPSYEWLVVDPIYLKASVDLKNELDIDQKNKTSSKKNSNLNSKYLNDQLVLNWRKFLIELGVNEVFRPKRKLIKIKFDDLSQSSYSSYTNQLNQIKNNEYYVFEDYECDVVNFYMNSIEKIDTDQPDKDLVNELTNLYRVIEEFWDNSNMSLLKSLNSFKYVSVYVSSEEETNDNMFNRRLIKDNICESKYYQYLKNKKWICSETNKYSGSNQMINIKTQVKLKEPFDVYVKEQVFLRTYGLNVSYTLNSPFKEKSTFSRDINLKFDFNILEFLQVFQTWYASNDYQINSKFCATLSQMKNIYLLIGNQLNSADTRQDVFDKLNEIIKMKHPIIFVPDYQDDLLYDSTFMEKPRYGSFYSSHQVFWSDTSGLFLKYKSTNSTIIPILLEPFYKESSKAEQLKQIFINEFNVLESPNLDDYVNLLNDIALLSSTNKSPFTYEETLIDIYKIFEIIVDKCMELTTLQSLNDRNKIGFSNKLNSEIQISDFIKNHLLALLNDKEVIPCYENKWISFNAKNSPILVDNDFNLAEKFIDRLNIIVANPVSSKEFTDVCRADNLDNKISYLFSHIFNFNHFSNVCVLDLENITVNLSEAPVIQNLCRKLVPFIQSFLYYRPELQSIYKELTSAQVQINKRLEKMKFYCVKELENTYRFKHDNSIFVTISNKTCVDTSESATYWKYFVRSDIMDNTKDIIKGFIKIFCGNRSSEKNEKELIKFCLLMQQFVDYKLKDDDKHEIEKDYDLKLSLPSDIDKWEIKEAIVNRVVSKLDQTELEDGELEHQNYNNNFDKSNQTSDGKSRRQKLLDYEKLSRNQLNLPPENQSQIDYSLMPYTSEFNSSFSVANKSAESIEINLSNLANRMIDNFNVGSINQTQFVKPIRNIQNSNDGYVDYLNQWSNLTLDNLNTIRLSVPSSDMNERSKEFISMIGKWGELWVNEMLKKKYENELKNNQIKIEWMNETTESGLPYDFRIINPSKIENNNMIDESAIFLEVKSTTKMNQESFPVSYQELLFAQKYSTQFEIYRLYNVATDDPNNVKMKIIKNIPNLLYTHDLNLFIVI